jgi:hypothetical protein
MAADEFAHESLQDLKSIGDYLRAIVQGPSGLLGLELRAKRRGNRAQLEIELSWTEDKGKTRAESLRVRTKVAD